jgi:hypothetical protein
MDDHEVIYMINKIKALFSRPKGQAMAEFSLALPILMLVMVGLLEAGRAVFMYSSVVNASREAVRYATAFGVDENDKLHVQNCAEIRNTARRVGFLLPLEDDDIVIEYQEFHDPDGTPNSGDEEFISLTPATCDGAGDGVDDGVDERVTLTCGDRVQVTVSADYDPILPLMIPLQAQSFSSTSARTFVGVVELSEDADECE